MISTITLLLPQVLIDSQYYGKLTIAPFNIVKYNVLSDHGPDLYGTEPWTYYLFNGILNFNVVFILGLLVWPLQGFIHLVVPLPNKGSQFILHILLSMGRFDTELDLILHSSLKESFRYVQLITTFPNLMRVIDWCICDTGILFHSVII